MQSKNIHIYFFDKNLIKPARLIAVATPKMIVPLTNVPSNMAMLKDARGITMMLNPRLSAKRSGISSFLQNKSPKIYPGNKKI